MSFENFEAYEKWRKAQGYVSPSERLGYTPTHTLDDIAKADGPTQRRLVRDYVSPEGWWGFDGFYRDAAVARRTIIVHGDSSYTISVAGRRMR